MFACVCLHMYVCRPELSLWHYPPFSLFETGSLLALHLPSWLAWLANELYWSTYFSVLALQTFAPTPRFFLAFWSLIQVPIIVGQALYLLIYLPSSPSLTKFHLDSWKMLAGCPERCRILGRRARDPWGFVPIPCVFLINYRTRSMEGNLGPSWILLSPDDLLMWLGWVGGGAGMT